MVKATCPVWGALGGNPLLRGSKGAALRLHEQRVSILQSETRKLEAFLGTLSHEDWQRSSRCDQWTVADVVAHLMAMDQDCAARIGRAVHGDASPPPQAPPVAGQAAADIAHHAIAVRQQLGDDLLPTFIAAQSAYTRPWRPSAQQTGTRRATIHKGVSRLGGSSMHSSTNVSSTGGTYNPCLTRIPGCHLPVCP